MSKKFQLTIPTPCQESWEKMIPVEPTHPDDSAGQGRFCESCRKKVVDFSRMSDREIAAFFKNPAKGSVCGRFLVEQLDRDLEVPKKRIPWIKYFFRVALPAFLLSARATAQGKAAKTNTIINKETCTNRMGLIAPSDMPIPKEMIGDTIMQPEKKAISLSGTVRDETGNKIAMCSVVIKGKNMGTVADKDGHFEIAIGNPNTPVFMVVSAIGYESKEIRVEANDFSIPLDICLKKDAHWLTGEVVVVGYLVRKPARKKSEIQPIPLIRRLKDTIRRTWKVFPNPAPSGTTLHIEWKPAEAGEYRMQLLNLSGQVVFNKTIWIDEEAGVLQLDLPKVAAGNYFLRMTSKKSGKSFTEKITVQQ